MAHSKPTSEKLNEAAPYNILYNSIPSLPTSQNSNTISFADLLCPSLGKLKSSLQISSTVDFEWLIQQYVTQDVGDIPLTVLYVEDATREGYHLGDNPHVIRKCFDEEAKAKFRDPHHEKIGVYLYHDNSIRIVISTANLYKTQWDCFIHGFWVSPKCPRLSDNSSGESSTNFKSDLLKFFSRYNLTDWYDHLKQTDFSAINVFLVTSIPDWHSPTHLRSHQQQVQSILRKHCEIPSPWPLIAQAPNMGQFGDSPDVWLRSFFMKGLMESGERLNIIFPTEEQVKNGAFYEETVKGVSYNQTVHEKQRWLEEYLYQWQADTSGRSKIMPQSKIYCRVSPLYHKIAWFLLTSSNINRGAWGQEYHSKKTGKKNGKIFVRNYEIGVMFIPKFFGKEYFEVTEFPLIFDMPLKKYSELNKPWSVP